MKPWSMVHGFIGFPRPSCKRFVDKGINIAFPVTGDTGQNLGHPICIGNLIPGELTEFVMGQQHGEDSVGNHHAGGGFIAGTIVERESQSLEELHGKREVSHRKVDEYLDAHGLLPRMRPDNDQETASLPLPDGRKTLNCLIWAKVEIRQP